MKHLDRDLFALQDRIVELGGMVEAATNRCIQCIENFDLTLAQEILDGEETINEMEVAIEEECLKILALHQPVAFDLRYIIVVLKVNNDLERMGDQAVNIAERVTALADMDRLVVDLDFATMGSICGKMVQRSIEALVRQDVVIAQKVLDMGDELDALHSRSYKTLQNVMKEDLSTIVPAISHLTISNNLERLGDLATNIAEEIIFMEEGEVVRHQEEH